MTESQQLAYDWLHDRLASYPHLYWASRGWTEQDNHFLFMWIDATGTGEAYFPAKHIADLLVSINREKGEYTLNYSHVNSQYDQCTLLVPARADLSGDKQSIISWLSIALFGNPDQITAHYLGHL